MEPRIKQIGKAEEGSLPVNGGRCLLRWPGLGEFDGAPVPFVWRTFAKPVQNTEER